MIATSVLSAMAGLGQSATAQTAEEAQHRLPPVIFHVSLPRNEIVAGDDVAIDWVVLGYHDDYEAVLALYDEDGDVIHSGRYYPEKESPGTFVWGQQRSKLFHFRATVNAEFDGNQDIIMRFFAVPPNDPIENSTALSVIVPGGNPIRAFGTEGRKLIVNGIDPHEYDVVNEFFDVYDTVCGDGIAQFTAHFKEPERYRFNWEVHVETPTGVVIDMMFPTPTSELDEVIALERRLISAIPGLGTIWSAGGVIAEFFNNGYISRTKVSYISPNAVPGARGWRNRKLNMRLQGHPEDRDWHLLVTVNDESPIRFPLRCFGSHSDNPDN